MSEDLDLLEAQVRALRELAGDELAGGERDGARIYDFSVRWGTYLSGRLQRLEYYDRGGDLTAGEHERYAALRSRLRDVLPMVDELGLGRPPIRLPDA